MRYSADHKDRTRSNIMSAAARVFREGGFGGAGIDALTKAAGVTNGAFYGHFKTKAEAFRAAVGSGLGAVRNAIAESRRNHGDGWVPAFAQFYLGPLQDVPLGEACVLPTLSSEVMRADTPTRAAYEEGLRSVLAEVADGMPGADASAREDAAVAFLALLAGGAMLARAVQDPALSARINQAVAQRASAFAEPSLSADPTIR